MEERTVVTHEPADTAVEREVVERAPETVVEQRPVRRTVVQDDPVGNAVAASTLIQTIVWSIVVLVLLVVVLWLLHVYLGLF
jgi:hypothetical protein